MPYVPADEALNLTELDLVALRRRMGPPPWRQPLVATPATRWALIAWPAGYETIPHVHPDAEEVFHVLDGRAEFRFGGEETPRIVGPNSVLLAHRGVWHAIRVPGPEALLLLVSVTPNQDLADETIEDPTFFSSPAV